MKRLVFGFLGVSLSLALSACQQGVGERCQVQGDCSSGLLCILPAGGTPQSGGTCQQPGGGDDAGAADLSVTVQPDLSGTD